MTTAIEHRVPIIGGGDAGISAAARLRRAGLDDVAVIEPASMHYYQPLRTLVGGGRAPAKETARPEASVMPEEVVWIKDRADLIDPDTQIVTTATDVRTHYDHLVVCPGIQLDWDTIPGMQAALDSPAVSSNYTYATECRGLPWLYWHMILTGRR